MKKLSLLCASSALILPSAAFAQSTGTIAAESESEIVVTGTRLNNGVEGIVAPDSTKARAVLTQEIIARQSPGQTILNTINLVPGVNFTQSDPYGSAGGNIRIRGFDGNRISLTFDGLPLNDTGNYAIFSNQQLDPELIEQVNVNLGTTDVDSPTASAAGGTVNYRTRLPGSTFGARGTVSAGTSDYTRAFGMIDTGQLFNFGTRAFVSASTARNDKFKGPGDNYKQQYNARVYHPLPGKGDFLSISGHYNQNRNDFYRNPRVGDLRTLFGAGEVPQTGTGENPIVIRNFGGAQQEAIFDFENDATCARSPARTGLADIETTTGTRTTTTPRCTNFFGVRINPSNTGNIRGASRFTLRNNLILTVDPSYQYVLANGGGISTLDENSAVARGAAPASAGVDYNADGDVLDRIQFYTPNTTNTRRYGLTTSLIWDVTEDHRLRVAYTFDRGRHRQTGEYGFLDSGGTPESVFGGRNGRPVLAADGVPIQQRDRLSIALLNQIGGQYIGRFLDDALRVELGLRVPFFKRELNQFCFTQTGGSGFATCTTQPGGPGIIVDPNAPGPIPSGRFFAPFEAEYKFDAVLPNLGFTYDVAPSASIFGSYAKGFSAPRTDNLYRAPVVDIEPETTDAFDLGARYTTRRIQAQLTGWMIGYKNRIVSSFNQELGISLDRNVGKVDSYGFDGSVAFKPIEPLTLYAFGSYIHAEFEEDVQIGAIAGTPTLALTKGRMVPETPEWTFGGRAMVELGPVAVGIQGKYVDDRFATDVNDVKVKGYTLFDLDARYNLARVGLANTYLQLNVLNLFDKFYFGNISTQVDAGGNPSFSVGGPRTFIASLNFGF